jgi:predicted DNA-binding protein
MACKRLLVSLEETIFNDISDIAKINKKSLSVIAKNLIETALEIHEDMYFSKLADKILKEAGEGKHKWISLEEAKEKWFI